MRNTSVYEMHQARVKTSQTLIVLASSIFAQIMLKKTNKHPKSLYINHNSVRFNHHNSKKNVTVLMQVSHNNLASSPILITTLLLPQSKNTDYLFLSSNSTVTLTKNFSTISSVISLPSIINTRKSTQLELKLYSFTH